MTTYQPTKLTDRILAALAENPSATWTAKALATKLGVSIGSAAMGAGRLLANRKVEYFYDGHRYHYRHKS